MPNINTRKAKARFWRVRIKNINSIPAESDTPTERESMYRRTNGGGQPFHCESAVPLADRSFGKWSERDGW